LETFLKTKAGVSASIYNVKLPRDRGIAFLADKPEDYNWQTLTFDIIVLHP
jgi:hypothetical protein